MNRPSPESIRCVLLADHPEAAETVARWTFEAWGRAAGRSFEQELAHVRGFHGRERAPLMSLAIDGSTVVGAAGWRLHEMDRFPSYEHWLTAVFVAEAARGRGIASLLVRDVMRRARHAGVERLYLQTEDLGGGLYLRHGFEPVQPVDLGSYRVLVMVADLVSTA